MPEPGTWANRKTNLVTTISEELAITADAVRDVVNSAPIRDMLIHREFNERRQRGEKSTTIIYDIMERYDISYSTARHICYGHRKTNMLPE